MLDLILIAILVIVLIRVLYSLYLHSSIDVSKEYLEQQSSVDSVRKSNESAIHRSNKLEISNGLRVGLNILYDHYKLRHGNLRDIWAIYVKSQEKQPKSVLVNGDSISCPSLNHQAQELGRYFTDNGFKRIAIRLDHVLESLDLLVILIACFINQITLVVYEMKSDVDSIKPDLWILKESPQSRPSHTYLCLDSLGPNSVSSIIKAAQGGLSEFSNLYEPKFDKGIAIEYHRRVGGGMLASTSFSQLALMSAVASNLKHLPDDHAISSDDKVLIVDSRKNIESTMLSMIKLLGCFISNCDVVISNTLSWSEVESTGATIVSVDQSLFMKLLPLESLVSNLGLLKNWRLGYCLRFLSMGSFKTLHNSKLRLIYLQSSVLASPSMTTYQCDQYRAILGARIVCEYAYPSIVGPILQTDLYDYRIINHSRSKFTFGCITQSNEIKLTNMSNGFGTVNVRGYNIGKTVTAKDKDNTKLANNEGFMPLTGIKGRWGRDGCLYIYQ